MKKFFTFLLFCAVFCFAPAFGQILADKSTDKSGVNVPKLDPKGPWLVCEIKTKGLVNFGEKSILKDIKAVKKEFYGFETVSEDVSTLTSLGNFDKVLADIEPLDNKIKSPNGVYETCHRVTYIFTEKPLVGKIDIKGRKELSKSKIKDAMSTKEKDPFDKIILDVDMQKISDRYRQEGFLNAKASYTLYTFTDKNKVDIAIVVSEGQETKVQSVKIEGVEGMTEEKLVGKLKNKPGKSYKEELIGADIAKMNEMFRNKGYADFKLEGPEVTYGKDNTEVNLSYKMSVGRKSKFGNTAFKGNTALTEKELKENITYAKGKRFDQRRLDESVHEIQKAYGDKGYLAVRVVPKHTYRENSDIMDIEFDITENDIFYIGDVSVEGHKDTKTYVLEREIVIKEGDIFRYSRLEKSANKIRNLGYIDSVIPDILPTEDPNKVDVVFDVKEGRPGMMTAGAAVSSLEGLYGELSLNHLNMFHRADRVSLRWAFGSRVLDYQISWMTPWIYGKPTSFGLDAYNTRRSSPFGTTTSAYNQKKTGGRVSLGPRFDEDKYRLNFAYSYEEVEISDVDAEYTGDIEEGTSSISALHSSFAIDTRDYQWDPSKGGRQSLGLELAGGLLGGTQDYYKISLMSNYNWKVFDFGDYPIVFSVSNRFGFVDSYADSSVPVYEKYFLGGSESVRGYKPGGQVGPEEGGKVMYVFNSELKFPIARENRKTLVQGAFFFDMGNAWKEWDDISLGIGSAENQIKTGAGFGIRFTMPAFPIRLDWGYGFNHKTGEDKTEFYFTIGNMF